MIKSRRMTWAGHVTRMGEKRNAYRILVGNPEGKHHWEDQDVGGWTILKLILERWDGMVGIQSIWLRIGPVEGSCEGGNEASGSIKRWEILEWLHNWQLLKKASAPSVSK
jgi:hypothetical protein